MKYTDCLSQLAKKEYTGLNLGLGRVRKILKALGSPQNQYPAIHIAGTNGKGSTAVITHSILSAAGYRVGLYTSPHLLDCRERIRIGTELISEIRLEKIAQKVFKAQDKLSAELTYFEILTVIAFKFFAEEKIDILVAEVGLGGRLDATNVIRDKLACIITAIDYDHTEILGSDLVTIAREKAGIIMRGVPVIAHTSRRKTDKLIEDICRQKKSPVFFLDRDFQGEFTRYDWQEKTQLFSYAGIYDGYSGLRLRLLGRHQVRNASLALACIEIIVRRYNYAIDKKAIFAGLKKAFWPGRFEIIKRKIATLDRVLILDGAHNVSGAKVFIDTFLNSPYARKPVVLVTSVMRDKDYRKICKLFSAITGKVIIFQANLTRALTNDTLVKEWQKYLPPKKILAIRNFEQLPKVLKKNEGVICVTGSLYAVAAAKNANKQTKRHRISAGDETHSAENKTIRTYKKKSGF